MSAPATLAPDAAAAPAARRAGLNLAQRLRVESTPWLFLAPVGVVFVVLYVIPLVQSAYYSFTDANGYSPTEQWVGLHNYRALFRDSSMLSSLGFTLGYAVATTLVVTVLAIPLAVVLNREFAGKNLVRAVFFFPAVPSVAVLGLVWTFILNPLGSGVLNSVLHGLFDVGPVPWLSDNTLARLSVVAVSVWAQTGWHAILYLAYLQTIPGDYYEAATIDGASGWRSFRSITLPLLMPAMTVSQLLLLTNGLKVYDLPFTLTKGGPGFATRPITQSLIERGIAQARIGEASALAVLFLLVVAAVVAGQMFLTRRLEGRYS